MANKKQLKDDVMPILEKYKCTASRCLSANVKFPDKKKKNVSILYSNIGIFFFKKKGLLKNLKEWEFISYFDLIGFEQINKTNLSVIYGANKDCIIEYNDIIDLVKISLSAYLSLYYNSPKFKPLTFKGFSINFDQSFPPNPMYNLSTIRYIALCAKYKSPYCENTISLFSKYEKETKCSITFDESCKVPNNYRILSFPILHLPIQAIQFSGFGPQIIIKLLMIILKYNKSLKIISLQNYKYILFNQMQFKYYLCPSVINWSFSNITMNELLFESFLGMFEYYKGEIQSLSFSNMDINESLATKICEKIKTIHCFSTLEVLKLENIKTNSTESLSIYKIFANLTNELLSFQVFICINWIKPICFNSSSNNLYLNSFSQIKRIVFKGFDFSNIPQNIQFQNSIVSFEFPCCIFQPETLIKILQTLSAHPQKIILDLSRIVFTGNNKDNFYNSLCNVPPFENLIEFDWSDNHISTKYLKIFIKTFINSEIKFLSISNCFYVDEINSLIDLLKELSRYKIWGLELQGGKTNSTFGSNFAKILPTLKTIKSLQHLNISHQFFSTQIIQDVVKTIEAIKVTELIIENSGLTKVSHFFDLYTRIMSISSLRSLGRPIQDLIELDIENTKYEKLADFKAKIRTTLIPSVRSIRVSFYQRYSKMDRFIDFLYKYPASLLEINFSDHFGIMTQHKNSYSVRSLIDPDFEEVGFSLYFQQCKCLLSPYESPQEDNTNTNFQIPSIFQECSDNYTFLEEDINENEIIKTYDKYITTSNANTYKEIIKIVDIFQNVSIPNDESFKSNIICNKPQYIIPISYKDTIIRAILEQQQEQESYYKSEQSLNISTQNDDIFFDESEISECTKIFDIDTQNNDDFSVSYNDSNENKSNVSISSFFKRDISLKSTRKKRRKVTENQYNTLSTREPDSTENFLSMLN